MTEFPDPQLDHLADGGEARIPRCQFVYNWLLESIRSGRLLPGDRIREEDLARTLSVSRTPVREALQQLQARRLLETVRGRGIIVVELTASQVMELYALREVLEGAAARLAAQHARPVEIAVMCELAEEFDRARGDAARMARINSSLHRAIFDAAGNRYMRDALQELEAVLSLLRHRMFSLPERHDTVSAEHLAIVDAIARRDGDGAEDAARHHIREAQRVRLQMIRSTAYRI